MRRERITRVELRGVTHQFKPDPPIFSDLNFTLPLGETVVLQGGPGSGRSILMKIMAGLLEPTAGQILYNDKSIHELSFDEFAPMRLSTTFGFEDGGLLMNKTLEENLRLGLFYHRSWRADRQKVLQDELVESFEIGPFLHLRPSALSASVKKIAGFVRTFLHNAQIVYLDEPSPGLGENSIKALNYWIERIRKESKPDEILVIASSDEGFLKGKKIDRFLKLENGKLIDEGQRKNVQKRTA